MQCYNVATCTVAVMTHDNLTSAVWEGFLPVCPTVFWNDLQDAAWSYRHDGIFLEKEKFVIMRLFHRVMTKHQSLVASRERHAYA
jgi:hypothetical protein